jgi:hypothetical protein
VTTTAHNIRVTSSEIGTLWIQYLMDSLTICVMKYFIAKTEDTQIKPVLQTALQLSQSHVQKIETLFSQEGFPVPFGFTDKDVNVGAPRLYSDPFHLIFIKNMTKAGMVAYGLALSLSSRADVRQHYLQCLKTSADLDEQATQVMLSKGFYVRPPYIAAPSHAEFIKDTDYLGTFFGQQRVLNCMEITHLFLNAQSNGFEKALITGFSQVAHDVDVRNVFKRRAEIFNKHVEVMLVHLKESGIPGPMSVESDVLNSVVAPFSDKLMLFFAGALNNMRLGYYAAAVGASLRADIIADYARLSAELMKFGLEAIRLLINKGWAEEPPLFVDRKELATSGKGSSQ